MPLFNASSRVSISAFFSSNSAVRHRILARVPAVECDQAPCLKAWVAAVTARSMSAALPAGAVAMISVVAGSSTSISSPELDATRRPPISMDWRPVE